MKIIRLNSTPAKLIIPAIGLAVLTFVWAFAQRDVAASLAYRGLNGRPDEEARSLADWLIETSPGDPYARLAAARYFEKTFEPNDLERSLREYETAAALSPNHFWFWQQLGGARDRSGDPDGAEAAYRRATELAPNYAALKWSYGNSLIRHGKVAEGFELIAQASNADHLLAEPAAAVAMQALGNVDEVRRVLGSSSQTNAAIANVLTSQKKYAEAYDAWSRVEPEDKKGVQKDIGMRLLGQTNEAHEMRLAAAIYGDIFPGPNGERPVTGQIYNGGFENGLKLRNAELFEWQIAEGTDPQIGLSEGVKHSGQYSLLMTFNAFEASSFRTIAQRAAVDPGSAYEFEVYYRADLKSKAAFKWEITDLRTGNILAATEALSLNGDWAALRVRFNTPANSDGIMIRFARSGCSGAVCPATGRLVFDDFSLKQL